MREDCGCIVPIILSIIAGIIIGILVGVGIIVDVFTIVWIALGVAAFAFLILIVAILFGDEEAKECICEHGFCLLAGIVGTVILVIAIFAVISIASVVAIAVLLGLGGFFFVLMLINLIAWVKCLILSACRCRA